MLRVCVESVCYPCVERVCVTKKKLRLLHASVAWNLRDFPPSIQDILQLPRWQVNICARARVCVCVCVCMYMCMYIYNDHQHIYIGYSATAAWAGDHQSDAAR